MDLSSFPCITKGPLTTSCYSSSMALDAFFQIKKASPIDWKCTKHLECTRLILYIIKEPRGDLMEPFSCLKKAGVKFTKPKQPAWHGLSKCVLYRLRCLINLYPAAWAWGGALWNFLAGRILHVLEICWNPHSPSTSGGFSCQVWLYGSHVF